MTRKILLGTLALTPIALIAHYVFHVSDTVTFVLAALALMPLAWLIGEATEHVAEHTGPGIGGFFNASFGNAPELIIALLAVYNGLPEVVRGSIIGSVVSNLLLVLGLTMLAGGRGEVDRRSLFLQLGDRDGGDDRLPDPVDPRLGRRPRAAQPLPRDAPGRDRADLALHRGHDLQPAPPPRRARHLRVRAQRLPGRCGTALIVLGIATVATAFVSEMLVGSLESFGEAAGLSDFFVAIVIVAIVGNAAEHGGAIVVARRGKTKLATEIAVSSAAQVAVFVAPAAALLSFAVGTGLPLTFRPVELAAMAGATLLVGRARARRRARERWKGVALVGIYAAAVGAFWMAGDR